MKPSIKYLVCGLVAISLFVPLTSFKEVYAMDQSSDRQQIIDVVNGVAMSADRREWEACRSYFVDEPFIDYRSLSGQPGAKVRASTLVKGWSAFLPKFKFTQHFITNHEVTIRGNTAHSRSYVHAVHFLPYAEGGELWGVYGTYDHELVKTSSGWKISKMVFHLLYQEGNKHIPALAARIPKEEKVSFVSEGDKLVGILYTPADYNEGEKIPAIIVTGSWITVKEQMASTYAKKLAAEGFSTLVFDFRGFGESGGEPRQYESPHRKIQDIKNAVTFLQTLPMIDPNRIGGLGVCASSGYMAWAAAEDKRVKAFAAIAPWLHDADIVRLIYGGAKGVDEKIAAGKTAKEKYEQTKVNDLVPACSATDKNAAMFGPFEYYLSPSRGAIPEWKNQFAVMSWPEWLQFYPINEADKISVPTLFIHSESAAIPNGAKRFYDKLVSQKEFYWMNGTQFDFYDNPPTVNEASKKAAQWFTGNLATSTKK
jgi:fermentation-respiration switch protein FrsA (DUF1100 family)